MSAELSMGSRSMLSKGPQKQMDSSISTPGTPNQQNSGNTIIHPTSSPSMSMPLKPSSQLQPHGEPVKPLVAVPTYVQVDDVEEYEHKLQVIRVKPEQLVILAEIINRSRAEMKQRIKRYFADE